MPRTFFSQRAARRHDRANREQGKPGGVEAKSVRVEDKGPRGSAFGSLLRRHRLEAGLSQEDLAERARISAAGIGALERGDRRTPQRETLALLANALGLVDGEEIMFDEKIGEAAGVGIGGLFLLLATEFDFIAGDEADVDGNLADFRVQTG